MGASHRAAPADTSQSIASGAPPLGVRILGGLIGGLGGGIIFGALMAVMGMLPMIASLGGFTSAAVGFAVHLVISVVIGLALTVPGGTLLAGSPIRAAMIGMVYGALWWVLGPLLIMPTMMSMPVLTIDGASLMSLMGHLLFGLILGVVAGAVIRRRR